MSLLLHLCKNMLMSRTKLELTSIVKSMIRVLLTENYAESEDEKACLSAKNRGAPMYSLLYYLLSSCGVLTGNSICWVYFYYSLSLWLLCYSSCAPHANPAAILLHPSICTECFLTNWQFSDYCASYHQRYFFLRTWVSPTNFSFLYYFQSNPHIISVCYAMSVSTEIIIRCLVTWISTA